MLMFSVAAAVAAAVKSDDGVVMLSVQSTMCSTWYCKNSAFVSRRKIEKNKRVRFRFDDRVCIRHTYI